MKNINQIENNTDFEYSDSDEYENVAPRHRYTRSDVMTVHMAIKCGKSSKNHKLHVEINKRLDRKRDEKNCSLSKQIRNRKKTSFQTL